MRSSGPALALALLTLAACQATRPAETSSVAGAVTTGPAGPPGPVGPPGPPGAPAPGGGILWKDATGAVVPRVVTSGASIVHLDAAGTVWQLDPLTATLSPFDSLYGGLYTTPDCSGPEYVALSLPRYAFTVGYDRSAVRVLPDDPATAVEGAVSGAGAYAGVPGSCAPYPLPSLIAPKRSVLALPPAAAPTFPYAAPLHPEAA